jgi:hypothetical protein
MDHGWARGGFPPVQLRAGMHHQGPIGVTRRFVQNCTLAGHATRPRPNSRVTVGESRLGGSLTRCAVADFCDDHATGDLLGYLPGDRDVASAGDRLPRDEKQRDDRDDRDQRP